MEINYFITLATGLIPMIVGFVWYHENVFGKRWRTEMGLSIEDLSKGNMLLIMGLSYVFACMLSAVMISFTVHQTHMTSLFIMHEDFATAGSEIKNFHDSFMDKYSGYHRTFGHGAAHGLFAGIFIAFPIIAIKSLFERRSWKFIFINAGYWLIVLTLMCGALCQFV